MVSLMMQPTTKPNQDKEAKLAKLQLRLNTNSSLLTLGTKDSNHQARMAILNTSDLRLALITVHEKTNRRCTHAHKSKRFIEFTAY